MACLAKLQFLEPEESTDNVLISQDRIAAQEQMDFSAIIR